MGILLVRHAEAVQEQAGIDDVERWLSSRGRAQAHEVAQTVRSKGLALSRFVASPRVRAVQTAELFAHELGFLGVVESLPALSFTVPAEHAARELKRLGAVQHVAAFGHMPTISEIAGRITNETRGGLSLCEALWIDQGKVVWAVAPR